MFKKSFSVMSFEFVDEEPAMSINSGSNCPRRAATRRAATVYMLDDLGTIDSDIVNLKPTKRTHCVSDTNEFYSDSYG